MIKVLITGRNGMIGSYLHSQLDVNNIITSIINSGELIEGKCVNLDLTDINKVNQFTEKCNVFDVLIFLVGLAHSKGKKKDLSKFREINYQTLYNLLLQET